VKKKKQKRKEKSHLVEAENKTATKPIATGTALGSCFRIRPFATANDSGSSDEIWIGGRHRHPP
jgi:hypothetical protein